jgi:hypothetical protein
VGWWRRWFGRGGRRREIAEPFTTGFHGDRHLLALVERLMAGVELFVETGANVGSTTGHVARTWPEVRVLACEANAEAAAAAAATVKACPNARVVHAESPRFLYDLLGAEPELAERPALFWLDAHGHGYDWPLAEEIRLISDSWRSAVLLVDDARVPDRPEFQFCEYDGQVCGVEYVADALAPGRRAVMGWPTYTEHTSPHHPLAGHLVVAVEAPAAERVLKDAPDYAAKSMSGPGDAASDHATG